VLALFLNDMAGALKGRLGEVADDVPGVIALEGEAMQPRVRALPVDFGCDFDIQASLRLVMPSAERQCPNRGSCKASADPWLGWKVRSTSIWSVQFLYSLGEIP
jgi:hypothetical protein